MMWWNHSGWGFGGWLAMGLMMGVLWGLLVALAVWLVHSLRNKPVSPRGGQPRGTDLAQSLLAQRFARGEIDQEEFTQQRKLLQATGL